MTKEELIKSFERNNWELHEIYKAKLLALSYEELADKLRITPACAGNTLIDPLFIKTFFQKFLKSIHFHC